MRALRVLQSIPRTKKTPFALPLELSVRLVRVRRLCVFRNPIHALFIPFQYPILDHVAPDGCGVIVELGDDRVEVLLGISGGGGELLGNSM